MKKEQFYEAFGNIDEKYIRDAHAPAKKKSEAFRFAKSALLKWGTLAACLCLVVTAIFAFDPILGPAKETPPYGNTISYVGWTDDPALYDAALNKTLLQSNPDAHLPIFKADTVEELEQFKVKYGTIFAMDQGYDSILSFNAAITKAQWEREDFYKDHSLLLIYVPATSGSLRFGVKEVITTDDSLCVAVEQKNHPETATEDMAGWLILMEVKDEALHKYTSIDAIWGESN